MLLFYEDTKKLYYCILVPAFVITSLVGLITGKLLLLLCSVALFLAFLCLLNRLAMKEVDKINDIFLQNAETQRYIELYENAKKTRLRGDLLLLANSNLIFGYLAKGDFRKAFDLCNSIKYYPAISKKPEIELSYLIAYMECCIYKGSFECAEEFLPEADKLLSRVSEKYIESLRRNLNICKLMYQIAKNDFSDIDVLFSSLSTGTESFYQSLQTKYLKGIYYEKTGDEIKATEEFRYVSENGKNLYIAKESANKVHS